MNKVRLENIIQYRFNDETLLSTALMHSSYANEQTGDPTNGNERLEFLGDAILDAVVSIFLFQQFPEKEEGELTKLRAKIVCEKALGYAGKKSGINAFLLLGRGEYLGGGQERVSIVADAMEALIGAVFMDGGFAAAQNVVLHILSDVIHEVLTGNGEDDYKSLLQELFQKDGYQHLTYRLIDEDGPDHEKTFTMAVYAEHRCIGTGQGTNKKEVEQNAAKDAFLTINKRGS